MNVRTFAKRYRGAPILIEETSTGPALFSALTLKQQRRAIGIRPVDSKVVRFARHIDKIVGGKIRIPKSSAFNGMFVDELIRFSEGPLRRPSRRHDPIFGLAWTARRYRFFEHQRAFCNRRDCARSPNA